MRITKLPEERKQEIMEVALSVFAEKGYEQTTMRDIASRIGIVPGLCYRYFASKQELFHEIMNQYIIAYCAPYVQIFQNATCDTSATMQAFIGCPHQDAKDDQYHTFFHTKPNEEFHTLLVNGICQYMIPFMKDYLDRLKEHSIITCSNTYALATFYLYGHSAIINDKTLSDSEKLKQIKEFCLHLFY